MKPQNPPLLTPIYLKTDPAMPWPQDKVFHLFSSSGLFLCRNHAFFRSSVPVRRWPRELAAHDSFLDLNFPKVPQRLLERIVGFFAYFGIRYDAEAAALLVWDTKNSQMQAVVPEQVSVVGLTWRGDTYPLEVRYQVPQLPSHLQLIGDLHSHGTGPAYASVTDQQDEQYRAGLHIVVGRVHEDPPEFHVEVIVDGTRFKIQDATQVLTGYRRRRMAEVPPAWLEKVTVRTRDSDQPNWPAQKTWSTDTSGQAKENPPANGHAASGWAGSDATRDSNG